ncbi:hypothetical protein GCM10028777_25690 [Angustibacter speluncae]
MSGERADHAPTEAVVAPSSRPRVHSLDGVRGIAIVLVVLGHGWIVWPMEGIDTVPLVRGLFHGGTVVVFFVIGGFVVTSGLLREHAEQRLDAVRFYLRRLVRIGVQLVPLAVVVVALAQLDPTDPADGSSTRRSLLAVLTFTWNSWFIDNALVARADLGHLWYLSVQQQVYLVLPLLVVLLARRRALLVAVPLVAAAAVVVHRTRLLDDGAWVEASLATTARADGLLVGVAVAALLGTRLVTSRSAPVVAVASGAALVVLVLLSYELGDFAPLRWWGLAVTVAAAGLVLALTRLDADHLVARVLSVRWLTWTGRASLAIYMWHYLVFYVVSRHTTTWHWGARTALALGVVALVAVLAQRFVEEPTRRWLATSSAFRAQQPRPLVEQGAARG